MIFIWFYIYWLLTWVSYEYFKGLMYVEPEEAKEFERMQLRSRGRIVPYQVDVKPISLELYDYLIIESLNYHQK